MDRTVLVTGAASGIGAAAAALLDHRGWRVIRADLDNNRPEIDIAADLGTEEGRRQLTERTTELSAGRLDGVLAIAGSLAPAPATVSVNFFGMVATLQGVRPLLSKSASPRAAGVASAASLLPTDDGLVSAMTTGDETTALSRATELVDAVDARGCIYPSTKKAFAQWVRRAAPTEEWAGAGIPLNAVAPGVIATPMNRTMISNPDRRESLLRKYPMPLNGIAEAGVVASLLAWLISEENSHLCGQVIFIDGGSEAVVRGDEVW